ncbi:MAG: DUF1285 domain-containing protein [Desulfomonile tiedjei]|uniref:DUF1285 domain-containing protein n=1 Tax=Desulfomonile tiedjei TaxID=2358 RepID=A0A9D6Z7Q4_9BACT|nr:DUF1285 domain-containing protein [Desulfomonile tiedjei]
MQESENGKLFDASPYLKLFIDKDGRWFQNGAEIVHPQIYRQFNEMLERGPDGEYLVRMGREICRVEVEDAPFVVMRVNQDEQGRILMELNDGCSETLAPERLWIGRENIPYSRVKGDSFHARFSRPAYYQLAQFIVTDDDKEFFLLIEGCRARISTDSNNGPAA